ncbi:MAG: hypothetical protein IPO90_01765 [Flavobacteriales bacterium]|nr:hypothetical protein [Flavobacteriales bacterium]
MDLRGKNILIISPEGWRGLHMSKHHVAQGLMARGNHVFWWGPVRAHHENVPPPEHGGVREVSSKHWLKGVNRLPRLIHRWYYGRMIRLLEEQAGARFDIIWCFDTSRMQWFPDHPAFRLLHLVDYDILYHGHGLMRSADLIVTTADAINVKVLTIAPNARIHKIGHALDSRWLNDQAGLEDARVAPPRTVVYSGQFFNTYIDWEALLVVAHEHPTLAFQFIGIVDHDFPNEAFQRLKRSPNVFFTGLKTKDELIPLVRAADILTFCFNTDRRMLERANPHKVLEYLSTGNLIVGTWTLEYEPHQDLLLMAPDPKSFPAIFNDAVARFTELNTSQKRSERVAFASKRTIGHLLDQVESLIKGTRS